MTETDPSQADFDTYKKLLESDLEQVATIQGRAKSWLPALTAIAGLAATVTILKGPDAAKDLNSDMRMVVAVLVALALLFLIVGLVGAYRAAFGSPVNLDTLDVSLITGLHERYVNQLKGSRTASARSFTAGLSATVAGTILLFVAQVVTWFPPAVTDSSTSYCLYFDPADRSSKIEVHADSIDLSKLGEGVIVGDCEKGAL